MHVAIYFWGVTFLTCVFFIFVDSRVEDWLFVYSPWPTVALCSVYLLVCFVGPKLMAGREPFQLKPFIMIYNLSMVAYSLYVTVEVRFAYIYEEL